jgi:hypothetical protein
VGADDIRLAAAPAAIDRFGGGDLAFDLLDLLGDDLQRRFGVVAI